MGLAPKNETHKPGLQRLAQRLAVYHKDEESLENALTQLFPTSTYKMKDDVRLLMEKYTMYKNNYTKQFQFQPELDNLSKF